MPTYNNRMASKMGLQEYNRNLSVGLLTAMYEDNADFTNSFRALADVSEADPADSMPASLKSVSFTLLILRRAISTFGIETFQCLPDLDQKTGIVC